MPYKDLEHEGDEDFLNKQENRKQVKDRVLLQQEKQPSLEESLDNLQNIWLSSENPFLWNGEI